MTGIELVALATTVVGGAVSAYGQIQANKANKRRERLEKQMAEANRNRERRRAARESQLAAATNEAMAFGAGVTGGSSVNTLGQQAPRSNEALSFRNTEQNYSFNRQMASIDRQAADAQTYSNAGGSLTSLGGTVFNNADTINRIFGTPTPA